MIKKLLSSIYLKHFSTWVLTCVLFVCFSKTTEAQTVLAPGDISIIGLNVGSTPRGFAFVTWKALDPNTKIFFSENGYNAGGTTVRWKKPYGYWENTSGAIIAAGTIISVLNEAPSVGSIDLFGPPSSGTTPTNSTFWTLGSSTGGHIFAYYNATLPSPITGNDVQTLNGTPLFALGYVADVNANTYPANWLTSGPATSQSSNLPNGLAASNTLFFGPNVKGAQYNGARVGKTLAEYKALVSDKQQWQTGIVGITFTTTSFPVNAPTAASVNHTGTLQVGQTLTGNYTYADADATAESGSTFKWYRSDNGAGLNKTAIPSATAKTYVLGAADVNKHISFEITPRDATEVLGTATESALRGPISSGVLPVDLVDFTVSLEGNHVKLNWQTSLEQNNKGFEIHRSADDNRFVKIAEVATKGIAAAYSFYDKQPLNGINYYQLVQVDNDGKPTTLGTKPVTFSLQASTFNVSPNPTKEKVTLQFEAGKYKQVSLSGANGKILKRIVLQKQQSELQLDLSAYPIGIYFVRLIGIEESIVKKVVKQ